MSEQTKDDKHWQQYRKPKENKTNKIESKINKPLIIFTFIIVIWLGALSSLKETLHMNSKLNEAFINGGQAGTYAQWALILAILLGSPIAVLWIKALWNNLITRITNWKEINFWEAMGITAFILFFAFL